MLHLLPFATELGPATYIYGVATDLAFRRRGLASQLLHEALRIVDRAGRNGLPDPHAGSQSGTCTPETNISVPLFIVML